jgi:hypothetical protein
VRAAVVRKKRQGSKIVAAERNGGVGVQNNQVQGERAAIYRRSPRVRVPLVDLMGWNGCGTPVSPRVSLKCQTKNHYFM